MNFTTVVEFHLVRFTFSPRCPNLVSQVPTTSAPARWSCAAPKPARAWHHRKEGLVFGGGEYAERAMTAGLVSDVCLADGAPLEFESINDASCKKIGVLVTMSGAAVVHKCKKIRCKTMTLSLIHI